MGFQINWYDGLTFVYAAGWPILLGLTFLYIQTFPLLWPLVVTIVISVFLQLISSAAIHKKWTIVLMVWMVFAPFEISIMVGYGTFIIGKVKEPYYDCVPLVYIFIKPLLAWFVYSSREGILNDTPYQELEPDMVVDNKMV